MPSSQTDRRTWTPLVLLCAAQFMVVLDITIVNVALPSIGASLHFAAADLQWVVTAYVIASGGLLLIGGRAGDLLGRRRAFVGGLLLFTAASLASGLSTSPGLLVAGRTLQGVGAALLTPAALSLVTTTYTGARRVRAMTVWGTVASAGIAVGAVAGGMLTSWASWEWIFFVNVPVGLGVALLTPRFVPSVPKLPAERPLDVTGAVSVVAGLGMLVWALAGVPEHGWGSARTLLLLALSAALLAAFAVVERRARKPLMPPALFRVRSLVTGAVLMLGATAIMAGTVFYNSVSLQGALGWSALETGLAFLPFVAAIAAAVHSSAHLLRRFGTRAVAAAGLVLVALGAAQLVLAPDQASYAANLLPGFLVLGFGVGLAFPAVQIIAMSDVDHESAGRASGLMMTAHEIGAALGVAVLSAIGASASGGIAAGYGHAFLAVTVGAALLAVLARVLLPVVRPAAGDHLGVH